MYSAEIFIGRDSGDRRRGDGTTRWESCTGNVGELSKSSKKQQTRAYEISLGTIIVAGRHLP